MQENQAGPRNRVKFIVLISITASSPAKIRRSWRRYWSPSFKRVAGKRRDILRAALLGGLNRAQETATNTEDSEISGLFDEMFDDF